MNKGSKNKKKRPLGRFLVVSFFVQLGVIFFFQLVWFNYTLILTTIEIPLFDNTYSKKA